MRWLWAAVFIGATQFVGLGDRPASTVVVGRRRAGDVETVSYAAREKRLAILQVDRSPRECEMRATFALIALVLAAAPAWAQDPDHKDKDKGKDKPAKSATKRQSNVISGEEIDAIRSEVPDAYQLIERLRPQYLRLRGSSGRVDMNAAAVEIQVVVNNSGRGSLSVLRSIPSISIKEIRFLNGTDASIEFGTNYGAGAILVFTQ